MGFFSKAKKDPEVEQPDMCKIMEEYEGSCTCEKCFLKEPLIQGNLHKSLYHNWIDMTKCEIYGIQKYNLDSVEKRFSIYLANQRGPSEDRPIIFLGTLKECEDYLQKIVDYKKGLK